ncbi:MAG: riboflavin synthase [Kiritimatiellae bacterium]|jgi:riboflavin synthase|nr:riboflavin synthase [Kiritimatiellia bacterium]
MFTGLVQKLGILKNIDKINEGWSLEISYDKWRDELELGESIAVQGACLTVTGFTDTSFKADLLDETMKITALRSLSSGSKVNLERALALGDRLGGHIVSGHVDETGSILSIKNRGRDFVLRVACSTDLARHSVLKGSITIDGISLTISGLGNDWIEVNIIPHTWDVTSFASRKTGDCVNLEGDIIGKYVARLMGKESSGITEEMLRENGFM